MPRSIEGGWPKNPENPFPEVDEIPFNFDYQKPSPDRPGADAWIHDELAAAREEVGDDQSQEPKPAERWLDNVALGPDDNWQYAKEPDTDRGVLERLHNIADGPDDVDSGPFSDVKHDPEFTGMRQVVEAYISSKHGNGWSGASPETKALLVTNEKPLTADEQLILGACWSYSELLEMRSFYSNELDVARKREDSGDYSHVDRIKEEICGEEGYKRFKHGLTRDEAARLRGSFDEYKRWRVLEHERPREARFLAPNCDLALKVLSRTTKYGVSPALTESDARRLANLIERNQRMTEVESYIGVEIKDEQEQI